MVVIDLERGQRSQLLGIVRRAKSSHIRWRAYAQGLVAGVNVQEDRLPIKHTDCRFGQWYYGQGSQLFGHLEIFEDISGPHEMLHAIYEQVYALVGQGEYEQAQKKLDELIGVSRTLLEQIELLEAEVIATLGD